MKKLSFLLVAIATLSMLVGCFDNNSNNNNVSGNGNTNVSSENNNSNDDNENKEEPFSMGTWEDNVYTNNFLKIKYDMPASWNRSSDAEIASIMNISGDVAFGEEEFNELATDSASIYYVIANDPTTGNNLSIISEKAVGEKTTEEYLEQLKTQLEAIEAIKYKAGEMSKETLGGQEYNTLEISIEEYALNQKYFVRKQGDSFIGIILTAVEGSSVDELAKSFK